MMTEAEAAVQRAVEAAAAARLPVPVEAYGALIKGWVAKGRRDVVKNCGACWLCWGRLS